MDKHVLLGTNGPLENTNDSLLHKHVLDPDLGCQLNRVLLYHTSTCNRLLLQSPNAPEHTLSHAPTLTRSAVIQYIVIFPTRPHSRIVYSDNHRHNTIVNCSILCSAGSRFDCRDQTLLSHSAQTPSISGSTPSHSQTNTLFAS